LTEAIRINRNDSAALYRRVRKSLESQIGELKRHEVDTTAELTGVALPWLWKPDHGAAPTRVKMSDSPPAVYNSNCSPNPGQSGGIQLVKRDVLVDGQVRSKWLVKSITVVSGPR
jgi:hypothetical protein